MVAHKIVIVGDKGVGNTKLPPILIPAVVSPDSIHVPCFSTLVELSILDVGSPDGHSDRLRPLSYPNTCTVVICYSLNGISSLESVESLWKPELAYWIPEVPIILVGTKSDTDSRQVSTEEVAANIKAVHFAECSSIADEGVQKLVYEMARSVVTRKHAHLYPRQKRGCSGVCIVA